ncbi:MAG TPA: molecular chaperone DnaJ [Blastocatellia bacterium]|nr:molecular chaperone DnaJ [Blastocatellia bacterium]
MGIEIQQVSALSRLSSPEEIELEKKRLELAELEAELAEQELALATLRAELNAFERRYLSVVGSRYAELDEIQAQIAELRAQADPDDRHARGRAESAREQANESAHAVGGLSDQEQSRARFKPSQNLKSLYREVAKRIHPDLAADDEQRERRQRFMAEANRAYEIGDEQKLLAILREWENCPESIKGDGLGAELIRVIRRIAQAQHRLAGISTELERLMNTDLYRLWRRAEGAESEGKDLLAEMAANVERDIATARIHLSQQQRQ